MPVNCRDRFPLPLESKFDPTPIPQGAVIMGRQTGEETSSRDLLDGQAGIARCALEANAFRTRPY
jgi:hypothetical protein